MDPSYAKGISDLAHSKFEWKQEKLEFPLAIDGSVQVEFDSASFHGVIKATNLTSPPPQYETERNHCLV
jgi:hypothetical protein